MEISWLPNRAAGSLLHLSSLPSDTGIGNLGQSAYAFIEFLKKAGISYWQMCPVGPTGYGDSPYQVFCSSAGNPYFIDWKPLVEHGIVEDYELEPLRKLSEAETDFGGLYREFFKLARITSDRFRKDFNVLEELYGEFTEFITRHEKWLNAYCMFHSLKVINDEKPWWEWATDRLEDIEVLKTSSEYFFHQFIQYVFRGQWKLLKNFAEKNGIKLIGDLPIYCAPDSSDVWASPELFEIDLEKLTFERVAGVPPDYFNTDGQYWGNPLYKWEVHADDNFTWWMHRLENQLELFDVIRIDHFRGFNDYWSISAESKNAQCGYWMKGPGIQFWEITKEKFPTLPFLAEDLGLISKDVHQLRKNASLPGMAVLQFAFDGDPENLYLPHNLNNSLVLYTGTHDNDTSNGWYASTSPEIQNNFRSYLNISGHEASWEMLRFSYRTVSPLVIVPVQDLLGLGSEARFNQPGISQGNWKWRLSAEQLEHLHLNCSAYLYEQAKVSGRLTKNLLKDSI